MSFNKSRSAYEKMLQNPKNRISTSGQMKQSVPDQDNMPVNTDVSNISGRLDIDSTETAMLAEIDARIAARKKGKLPPIVENLNSPNIEKRLKEVENLLVEIMKVHMKIINKGLI